MEDRHATRRSIEKTIILNAGESKRLRPLTNGIPKCLLKLDNTTILEHQLHTLKKFGILEIVLVVGYHSEMIIQKVKQSQLGLTVRFVHNSIYYKTNTVYSLWLAKNEMNKDFIFLNGDVVFHQDILKRLIDCGHDNCLAIDKKTVKEEEVKVQIADGKIKKIGKEVEPTKAHGEFVGIAKFSQKITKPFKKSLDEVVREGKVEAFFELAVDHLLGDYNIYAVDVSDFPCVEIDTYEDYKQARQIYQGMTKIR